MCNEEDNDDWYIIVWRLLILKGNIDWRPAQSYSMTSNETDSHEEEGYWIDYGQWQWNESNIIVKKCVY